VAFFELLVADSRMLLWLKDVFTYLVKPWFHLSLRPYLQIIDDQMFSVNNIAAQHSIVLFFFVFFFFFFVFFFFLTRIRRQWLVTVSLQRLRGLYIIFCFLCATEFSLCFWYNCNFDILLFKLSSNWSSLLCMLRTFLVAKLKIFSFFHLVSFSLPGPLTYKSIQLFLFLRGLKAWNWPSSWLLAKRK
jgi:hypothetical protein